VSDDQDRVAHLKACEAEAHAAVPAEPRTVAVPTHADEIMSSHQGTVLAEHFSVAEEAIA
jgi:hypothetical protein